MPIYEYRCKDCGRVFEDLILKASDENDVKCPSCGSHQTEKLMSASMTQAGNAMPGGGAPAGGGCQTGG